MHFLTTLIPPLVDLPPKIINESSRALVLDFRFYLFAFLHCIIFLSYFFFKFALLMTVPQSARLYDATERLQLIVTMHRPEELFWSCNSTFFHSFLPFCLAALYLFCDFLFFYFCTFDELSC